MSAYTALANLLDGLGPLAYKTRTARGLSLRAAADAIGISFATLHRIEQGDGAQLASAVLILRWLGTTPAARPSDRT